MATEDRSDRRVRRTRQRLHTALISLIMENDYDKITVQDLIDRADVGRSTFYAHYGTKDDLLVSGLDHLTDDIERHMVEDPSAADMILPGLGIFQHVAENHRLFSALLGSRGIDLVHKAAFDAFTEHAMAAIERRTTAGEQTNIPADARAAFAAGALMAFIGWWLDNDMPYTPETMDDLYRQLTVTA